MYSTYVYNVITVIIDYTASVEFFNRYMYIHLLIYTMNSHVLAEGITYSKEHI